MNDSRRPTLRADRTRLQGSCRGGARLLPKPDHHARGSRTTGGRKDRPYPSRWNRRASVALAALLTFAALPLAGCWEGPGADRVRWAVERQLPGTRYDQEVHVRLGRITTGFARWVANLALSAESGETRQDPDVHRAKMMVNAVRRVEVAVYQGRPGPSPEALEGVTLPRSLESMLHRKGWHVLMETRDAGQRSWVLTRQEAGALRALYLVSLDPSELAVVRLEGRFDEAFARALGEDPGEATGRIVADAEDAA